MFKKIKNIFSYKKVNFKDYNLPHEALYKKILVQSYNDWFFKDLEVKNDINGRFEIIILHIFIIFNSLDQNNSENKLFKQNLLETFIDELESTYRELGISDNTFSKKMKIAAKSMYGRLNIYSNTINDRKSFNEALLRNIWPLDKELTNKVHKLSEYVYKKIHKYNNKSYREIIEESKREF
tara:strand:- start:3583 stop:4125 length:543 start_codon:yes stop_codon:yes gene_type:complete